MTTTRTNPTRWVACLLVLVAAIAYMNSLDAPFVFDDAPAIVDNPSIRRLSDPGAILHPPAAGGGRPPARHRCQEVVRE